MSLPPSPRRSPGRSGLHGRWVAGLLALLLGAALASVGAVAGAQQDPGTSPPESSAPETSAPDTNASDTTAVIRFTAPKPGRYRFYCKYHQQEMQGWLTVT